MSLIDSIMRIPLAKEGYPFIFPLLGITVLIGIFSFKWAVAPGILTLFVIYFFRDPERMVPSEPGLIVSPADGRVIDIKHVEDDNLRGGESTRVSIFLSVFNVHVNRIPCEGNIIQTVYTPGKFLPAFRDKASLLNEQNSLVIDHKNKKIVVKQIAGLIARRIVCWVKEGYHVTRGQRFGLIRFGSRVDLFVPKEVELVIKKGDSVIGGKTIIGKIKDEI